MSALAVQLEEISLYFHWSQVVTDLPPSVNWMLCCYFCLVAKMMNFDLNFLQFKGINHQVFGVKKVCTFKVEIKENKKPRINITRQYRPRSSVLILVGESG